MGGCTTLPVADSRSIDLFPLARGRVAAKEVAVPASPEVVDKQTNEQNRYSGDDAPADQNRI
jgi:hypothetical protein